MLVIFEDIEGAESVVTVAEPHKLANI